MESCKGAYKRALESTSLKDKWKSEHQKAFITLKVRLLQEPVLQSPQYDSQVFHVTSDSLGDSLAGWLSQAFKEMDKNRKTVTRWYPISYCSKCTSASESRYEPFLLEFAAPKYCIDEFEPYILRAPITIETDCQVLRDCLLKDKLNTHHSWWMESILSHNIINIHHHPGIENLVADGLSRMWCNQQQTMSDGSSCSVLPDWEASKGMKNNIMLITDSPGAPKHHLEELFQGDIFFSPIVHHLLGKSTRDSVLECKWAMHRSEGFTIENDKLWQISTKTSDRVA